MESAANNSKGNSTRTSSDLDLIVKKYLVILAYLLPNPANDLSDGKLVNVWIRALEDLPVTSVASAFAKLIKNFKPTAACPFPVPAHLREQIDSVNNAASVGKAELAWLKALEYRRRFFDADKPGQVSKDAPPLSQRMQNACRASGVLTEITEPDQLHVWGKKQFIESYLNWEILELNQHLLPNGPVKDAITKTARAMAPDAKQMAAPPLLPIGPEYIPEVPHATITITPLTNAQFEERKERLRRQAEDFKAKYPNEWNRQEQIKKELLGEQNGIRQ
jgi:hypothetical protein